ncbi:hypothetical protein QQ045_030801 [Rhodiola kirilowii]
MKSQARGTTTIPESIVNLSRLMQLDVRNNKLSGHIPRQIDRLTMLSPALFSKNQISISEDAGVVGEDVSHEEGGRACSEFGRESSVATKR